jgi:hypothetical protein
MITDTSQKIKKYLKEKGQATASEMAGFLGISPQALFRQLAKLQNKGEIYKVGRPPKVFYFLKEETVKDADIQDLDYESANAIEKNFFLITPAGEKKEGMEGFKYWCDKNNLPLKKTVGEYLLTLKKYNQYRGPEGLIDGTEKIKTTFSEIFLDKLFYLDFYSIERFGKTKLGQLLLYAKQSQDRTLIKNLIGEIKDKILEAIKKYNIDGIGFIPPTVKREVQFMKELEKSFGSALKIVKITKIRTEIPVPQKTLNKLEDRVENASRTFAIEDNGSYENILLIDDAVGSGATMNEVAGKIKKKGICRGKIIGLSITGSFKGFDVISEV